ncbi:MAG: hypothetical protein OEX04_20665 [Acidimicrobiia bacterium]|nr:hypothetical protein [Acidimicrobiia bacterium]MDH4309893.1 hypothetical protein [Acidimicrobiia bacterium]MDH5294879.1 hypothetical protein [Acidimicrobiia bacterium]
MTAAATIAVVLFTIVALFQILLAAGMPWGAAAWGGQNPGVLPNRLRVSSAVSGAVVFPLLALYVIDAAGLAQISWLPGSGRTAMWVLCGFFVLGTLMNAVSRSRIERIWAPVNLVLAICCLVVAINA